MEYQNVGGLNCIIFIVEEVMSTIDIAMATYNGEQFISDQINSIIEQTHQDWVLYISDDGSTDQTIDIINNFSSKDSRIKLINTDRQGGVISNFNKALESTNADFVVLSDQDDLWPQGRLEVLLAAISKDSNVNQPKLIFTDLTLINEAGETIAKSFYKENSLNPLENSRGYNLLWKSTVYGCTTIMNRALLDVALPIPVEVHMHDQWLAMKAHQNRGLEFIDVSTIMYRQHNNNVVGGINKGILNRIKDSKHSINNIYNSIRKTKSYLRRYEGLYFHDRTFISNKDFFKFALLEILPNSFKSDKKLNSLIIFILFLIS